MFAFAIHGKSWTLLTLEAKIFDIAAPLWSVSSFLNITKISKRMYMMNYICNIINIPACLWKRIKIQTMLYEEGITKLFCLKLIINLLSWPHDGVTSLFCHILMAFSCHCHFKTDLSNPWNIIRALLHIRGDSGKIMSHYSFTLPIPVCYQDVPERIPVLMKVKITWVLLPYIPVKKTQIKISKKAGIKL